MGAMGYLRVFNLYMDSKTQFNTFKFGFFQKQLFDFDQNRPKSPKCRINTLLSKSIDYYPKVLDKDSFFEFMFGF